MRLALHHLLPLTALAPLAPGLVACGKGPNVGERSFLQFAHGLPEAPRPLALRADAPPAVIGAGLVVRGDDLVAADSINGTLVVLGRDDLALRRTVTLGGRPEAIAVLPDGGLWVSLRAATAANARGGEVVRLDAQLAVVERVALGRDVHGLALSPSGTTLFATLPFEGDVVTLREAEGAWEEVARTRVGVLPRGLAWASAGNTGTLVVALQHGQVVRVPLGEDGLPSAVESPVTAALRVANPTEFRTPDGALRPFKLRPTQPTRAIAMAMNPESGQVYVAHVLAAHGDPASLVSATAVVGNTPAEAPPATGGYGSSDDASSLDAAGSRAFALPSRPLEATVSVVDPASGQVALPEDALAVRDPGTGRPMSHLVDQPSALAHHPSHSLLLMAGEGSDNVLVLSTAEGDPMRSPVAVIDVGAAPRAIAIAPDGGTAYVLSGHDFAVSALDLRPLLAMQTTAQREVVPKAKSDAPAVAMAMPAPAPDEGNAGPAVVQDLTPGSPRVEPVHLAATRREIFGFDPRTPEVARGARLFTAANNTAVSHAGQFACASCHYEGLEDGVVWVTPDGVRQTIALAGRLAGTGPFNWNGSEDALGANMDKTIARMGGEGLMDAELRDLEAFLLHGLTPLPALRDSGLTPQEQLGQALFEDPDVGCASCHQTASAFTDGRAHDVGTLNDFELKAWQERAFSDPGLPRPRLNTPSLTGLAWTAPYLHDGSAATLGEMFVRTGDQMGRTSQLTPEERDALVAYLLTL